MKDSQGFFLLQIMSDAKRKNVSKKDGKIV